MNGVFVRSRAGGQKSRGKGGISHRMDSQPSVHESYTLDIHLRFGLENHKGSIVLR